MQAPENGQNCPICLDVMESTQAYTIPECGHQFHNSCIIPWFRRMNNSCPYCRAQPDGPGFRNQREVIKLWQRLSRRKDCPPGVKKLCTRITRSKKKLKDHVHELTEYKRAHKEVLTNHTKLSRKRWDLWRKCRHVERELCALPAFPLLSLFR